MSEEKDEEVACKKATTLKMADVPEKTKCVEFN